MQLLQYCLVYAFTFYHFEAYFFNLGENRMLEGENHRYNAFFVLFISFLYNKFLLFPVNNSHFTSLNHTMMKQPIYHPLSSARP